MYMIKKAKSGWSRREGGGRERLSNLTRTTIVISFPSMTDTDVSMIKWFVADRKGQLCGLLDTVGNTNTSYSSPSSMISIVSYQSTRRVTVNWSPPDRLPWERYHQDSGWLKSTCRASSAKAIRWRFDRWNGSAWLWPPRSGLRSRLLISESTVVGVVVRINADGSRVGIWRLLLRFM